MLRHHRGRSLGPLFSALVLGLLIGLACVPPASAIQVGQPLPNFDLRDVDGEAHRLSGQSGYVVLLYFFGHSAQICRQTAPLLQTNFHREYHSEGLRVYGVDSWDDQAAEILGFREATGVEFPLLQGGMAYARGCGLSYNSFVVADASGIVRYVSEGPKETAYDEAALRQVIERSLDQAAEVQVETWGAIKSLYGR